MKHSCMTFCICISAVCHAFLYLCLTWFDPLDTVGNVQLILLRNKQIVLILLIQIRCTCKYDGRECDNSSEVPTDMRLICFLLSHSNAYIVI